MRTAGSLFSSRAYFINRVFVGVHTPRPDAESQWPKAYRDAYEHELARLVEQERLERERISSE